MHRPYQYIDEARSDFSLGHPQVSRVEPKRAELTGKRRKAYEWTSPEQVTSNALQITMHQWDTLSKVKVFSTAEFEPEVEELRADDFDISLMESLEKGLITEEWVVDLYIQQQLLQDHIEELMAQHPGKVVTAIGGEFFIGSSVEEAMFRGRLKYPNRPFYATSFSESIESF